MTRPTAVGGTQVCGPGYGAQRGVAALRATVGRDHHRQASTIAGEQARLPAAASRADRAAPGPPVPRSHRPPRGCPPATRSGAGKRRASSGRCKDMLAEDRREDTPSGVANRTAPAVASQGAPRASAARLKVPSAASAAGNHDGIADRSASDRYRCKAGQGFGGEKDGDPAGRSAPEIAPQSRSDRRSEQSINRAEGDKRKLLDRDRGPPPSWR